MLPRYQHTRRWKTRAPSAQSSLVLIPVCHRGDSSVGPRNTSSRNTNSTAAVQDDCHAHASRCTHEMGLASDAAAHWPVWVHSTGKIRQAKIYAVTPNWLFHKVLLTMGLQRETAGRGTMAVYVQVSIAQNNSCAQSHRMNRLYSPRFSSV